MAGMETKDVDSSQLLWVSQPYPHINKDKTSVTMPPVPMVQSWKTHMKLEDSNNPTHILCQLNYVFVGVKPFNSVDVEDCRILYKVSFMSSHNKFCKWLPTA